MYDNSRYHFEENSIEASDKEWRTFRLTNFNEKIQVLLSKSLRRPSFDEVNVEKNLVKDKSYVAPHLALGLGVIRPVVCTVGDPFRCELVASLCEKAEEIKWNREYRTFNVTFEGAEMTIVSHGIGGPGAAICFEELIKLGATTIFRLGTCGSLKPNEIKQGDLVVSTAACREDGHTHWVVPKDFPAVADPQLVVALYNTAIELGFTCHLGVTLTSGNFYPGPAVASTLQVNADAGAISVEMENATLFCVGTVRGIRTAAIGTIDGSPFKWDEGDYDPHGNTVAEGKKKMITVGLKVAKMVVMDTPIEEIVNKQITTNDGFSEEESAKMVDFYKNNNIFDYIMAIDSLKNTEKAKIFQRTFAGIVSDLMFFLDKATSLTEEQIKDAIILFYKVKRGQNTLWDKPMKEFIVANMPENESQGPK